MRGNHNNFLSILLQISLLFMFIPAFKGHSSLWDRADLKKFTPTWNQSSFRISAPIFAVVCLIFNRSLKNLFECPFARPMILFLSYLVKNSIMSGVYRVSAVTCKLAMKWYLILMCVSWLLLLIFGPFYSKQLIQITVNPNKIQRRSYLVHRFLQILDVIVVNYLQCKFCKL